jgi:hypothetical protein
MCSNKSKGKESTKCKSKSASNSPDYRNCPERYVGVRSNAISFFHQRIFFFVQCTDHAIRFGSCPPLCKALNRPATFRHSLTASTSSNSQLPICPSHLPDSRNGGRTHPDFMDTRPSQIITPISTTRQRSTEYITTINDIRTIRRIASNASLR